MYLLGQEVSVKVIQKELLQGKPTGWYRGVIRRCGVETTLPKPLAAQAGTDRMVFYGVILYDFPLPVTFGFTDFLTAEGDLLPVKPYPVGFLPDWREFERITGWKRPITWEDS